MHPRARSSADILASAKAAPQTAHFKNYKNLKARADTGGPKNRGPSAIYAHALCKFPANETRLVSGKVSQDELVTANRAAHPTCSTQVLQIGRIQPTVFTFKPPITPTSYNEHSRKLCNCVTEVARDMDSKNEATLASSDTLMDNQEIERNASSDTLMHLELAYPSESTAASSPSTTNESRVAAEILGLLRGEGLDPFDLFLMVFDPKQPELNDYQAEILDDNNPKLSMILDRIIVHPDGRAKVSQWLKHSGLGFVHDIVSQEMEEVQRTAKLPGPVSVDADFIKTCISGYPALVPWTTEVLLSAAEASLAHPGK